METWKTCTEFPEYQVSTDGQIRSIYTMRPLLGGIDKDGYRRLIVCSGGRRVCRNVRELVCSTYHGPRPEGAVIRHIDGSRTNDAPSNLAWCTQKENMADKLAHGTAQRGEKHGLSKLTEADVRRIRDGGERAADVATALGIAKVTVYHIRERRLWKHIP